VQIIVIQKYLRRYLAKCVAAQLRKQKKIREAMILQAKLDKEAEIEQKRLKELDRRVNPKTKYDFDMIACDLESTIHSYTLTIHLTKNGRCWNYKNNDHTEIDILKGR